MIKENRIAYGVRVKLLDNFVQKCIGDKYLKEQERVWFIRDTKAMTDEKGKYVYITGGSLLTSGYAYLDELEVEFDMPERPLTTIAHELDRQDLIKLIKGSHVQHEMMNHPQIKLFGFYRGGMHDEWV